ncbi:MULTISPECIES: ABC transporter substrate-binding protein [unclassified Microbacterium]|uniref:ABC transporter substrate-binding protein n=1 Tax=unclassified Microbacterium TaxID=2609290 RepID=UPI0012F926F8|nr:extracellular solute-binding protein [Microbacterium sp. MAH-37]MVQ42849.1 extracellular solute-binding protein [Microbacterium sp. MAH-37]
MKRSGKTPLRIAVAIAAVAATAIALAGCSGSSDEAASDKPLQFFLSGDANQGGGYAHMAEKYEKETGVKVQIVDIANDDLPTKLSNAAQANDLPALARVGAVDPVWRNATTDLTDITKGSKIRTDLADKDGDKVISLPSDITAVGLFINKTLFDQAGVAYPTSEDDIWTWDEYVAAVEQVQQKTGTTYGMVMDKSSHRLKALMYEFGSDYFQPDKNGTFSTNDDTKRSLEFFNGLNDDKFMPRSVWLSDADPNALFKSGDVVSYVSGSWQIADFAVNIKNFEWASVYMPQEKERATNFGNAASIVVFDGPQQKAAHDFVKWLYEPENYTELSETSSFIPAVDGLDITYAAHADAFDVYNRDIAASPAIVGDIKAMELQYGAQGVSTEGDPVRDETVKYLNGEQDVDKTISNINEQFTDQLGALK